MNRGVTKGKTFETKVSPKSYFVSPKKILWLRPFEHTCIFGAFGAFGPIMFALPVWVGFGTSLRVNPYFLITALCLEGNLAQD